MYKIGLSTKGKALTEKLFAEYQSAGVEAMEIALSEDKYDCINYQDISRWSKKYSVELWSIHLPFSPFSQLDISSHTLSGNTVAYLSELIKKASDIGIDKFVLHTSGEPIVEEERKERMSWAKESLCLLSEVARKSGAMIAVEDLPRSCLGRNIDEVKELISVSSDLRVCFDTNHLLQDDPLDFARELGDKIITVHISDYDKINERHWLPGEGIINWTAMLTVLKEIGYKGCWMYEVPFACPKTIIRSRDLTCEDFVKNAKEIFTKQKITVHSTPKPNLGLWE